MAEVKERKKAAAKDAPLRMGAKAKRLLESVDKPVAEKNMATAKAKEIADQRGDRIIRDYYLYQALGMPMPPKVAEEWAYFEKNGKELAGITASARPKRTGGQGNAGTSGAKAASDAKPTQQNAQSKKRSDGNRDQKATTSPTESETSSTTKEHSSNTKSDTDTTNTQTNSAVEQKTVKPDFKK